MITRENYEEYFLLYGDNELSPSAKSAVERFVAENPDLQEEWETLLQCRVDADPREEFPNKELLLQADLLSYVDGELDADGRRSIEEFTGRYPSKALELEQLLMTVSQPDLSISFPDKENLYRSERRRVLLMPWMRAGIAAAVLGLAALLLLTGQHKDDPRVAKVLPSPAKKNVSAPVTPSKPVPLYSTGSGDQGRDQATAKSGSVGGEIAKNDPGRRKEQRRAQAPAAGEKAPEVAVQQREVAQATTVPANADNSIRVADPALNAKTIPGAEEKTLIKPVTAVAAVNIPKEQSSFATQALLEEQQAEETGNVVAAAPAGKNKLRGLFRKVSRTFGKTADRDDDGQKEVLISAFQVALK